MGDQVADEEIHGIEHDAHHIKVILDPFPRHNQRPTFATIRAYMCALLL
jgi:hypothetical protein